MPKSRHFCVSIRRRTNTIDGTRLSRNEALAAYSWLHTRPDLILAVDVLEEDDKQHFARAN